MQAGLSRAIPMAIIGFMIGALVTIILRGLQSLDPIWAAGPGLVTAGFFMAGFFVWGMGAFDPKLSAHGEAEEAAHEEIEKEAAKPRSILLGSTWMIATIVIIVVAALAAFAILPGGFGLIQTVTPGASTAMVGYTEMPLPFGGPTITVSTLVIFGLFILIAFLSLAFAAWLFGAAFTYLARGLNEVQTAPAGGGTLSLPAPDEPEKPQRSVREQYTIFGMVLITFLVLYFVFNLVLGIIFPNLNLPILTWFFDAVTQVSLIALVLALVITWIALGRERFTFAMPFIVTFVVLYLVFYYVAIGLILPNPSLPVLSLFMTNPQQLFMLSFVNALIFTLLILRPMGVLHTIGIFARWLAHVLRSVPKFLQ